MKKKLYIAYGSNLNKKQMAYRCPDAKPIASGLIDGWKLVFRGIRNRYFCSIIPSEGDSVPVGIWEITEADERSLDVYEGDPVFYDKKTVRIKASGGVREALVYIMQEPSRPGVPFDSYVETCRTGYKDFGLPMDAWEEALEYNRQEVKA